MDCKKVKFRTEQDAKFALSKIKKTSNRVKVPVDVYLCLCGAWHLTSKPNKDKLIKALEIKVEQLESEIKRIKIGVLNIIK